MATGGIDPDKEEHINYYDLLEVSFTSTGEEIRSAFLQKARRYHPDKNYDRNTEELMKLFNKAYQVLRDPVERERYDERMDCDETSGSQKPLAALGHGNIASLEVRQLYESSLRSNPKYLSVIKNFSTTLNARITEFYQQKFKDFIPNHDLETRTQSTSIHKHSILTEILSNMDEVHDIMVSHEHVTFRLEDVLFDIVKYAQTVKNPNMVDVIPVGTEVPIIDFSHIGIEKLCYLLNLFDNILPPEKLFEANALAALDPFVPKVHVSPIDATLKKKFSFKPVCCLCKVNKSQYQLRLPRVGLMSPQNVCQQCKSQTLNQDMNEWINLGCQFLLESGSKLVPKVVGCFAMAICTNPGSKEPFLKFGKEFVACGMPHIAMVLVPNIIKSIQQKEVFKGYLLAASALKCMCDFEAIVWFDKWSFLLAAKEAFLLARCIQEELDESLDIPSLPLIKAEMESKIFAMLDEKEVEYNNLISKTLAEFELAWGERKISKMIKLITAERDNDLLYVLNKEVDYIAKALEHFISSKEVFEKMLLTCDQSALSFLKGVLKLQKGALSEGVSCIVSSVWRDPSNRVLTVAALDIIVELLPENYGCASHLGFLQSLIDILATKDFKKYIQQDNLPLLPTLDQLEPPYSTLWPNFTVDGLKLNGLRKYEDSIDKNVKSCQWTEFEAGLACIDYVTACNHPAELALCYLTACGWFLKAMRRNSSMSNSECYAYKTVIFHCLTIASMISHMMLHSGLTLYVSRVSLAIGLHAANFASKFMIEKDVDFLRNTLSTFAYNVRLHPFLTPNTVNISEAVLLNIFSGRFHSEFLLSLKSANIFWPVSKPELLYHIYENHLRHLCDLDDRQAFKLQMMEEMLTASHCSLNLVTEKMSNNLSPRDSEGWLIQQPKLGMNLEYAKIVGLSIDKSTWHIELLVQCADRHNVGLLSLQDVDMFLSLDSDKCLPLFFSLDPPDPNKQYHPFQQWRFHPETIDNTDLLYTLFETDYLLKSFSVGSEVSAYSPFSQRPCYKGLLQNLPKDLQKILKPVAERGNTLNNINRFWIQADKLKYSINEDSSKIEFRISSPKMSIRSHPLMPGTDGELHDTDNPHDHTSPEACFARDLTDHYHYIGQYFPMFLRLQELVKLSLIPRFIDSLLHSLQEGAKKENIKVPSELLDRMQQQVQNNIRQTIDSSLENIITQIGSNLYLLDQREVRSVIASQVTDAIITGHSNGNLNRHTLQNHVDNWLRNRYYKTSLLNYIVDAHRGQPTLTEVRNILYDQNCQKLRSFKAEIQHLRRNAHYSKTRNSCKWVPAALLVSEEIYCSKLCYGGVLIAPKIEQGYVPLVPSSKINLTTARRQYVADLSGRSYRTVYGRNKFGGRGSAINGSKKFASGHEGNDDSRSRGSGSCSSEWAHVFGKRKDAIQMGHVQLRSERLKTQFKEAFIQISKSKKKSNKTDIRKKELDPVEVKVGESFYTKRDGETWSPSVRVTKKDKVKVGLDIIESDEDTKFKTPFCVKLCTPI